MSDRTDTVGFIGMGRMGLPMALNLVKKGFPVVGYDIDPARVDMLVSEGGGSADGPAAVARAASKTVIMVETTEQARTVIMGQGGIVEGAEAGDIVIASPTIDPLAVKAMHAELAQKGIGMIDAPVSGGVGRATSGELTIAVGGDEAAIDACRPILEAMSSRIFQMGEIGQGIAMKLVNNMLNQINKVASAEAMAFGVKAGLDPEKMIEMIQVSSGQSASFEAMAPRYLSGDFLNASTLDISFKDQELETAYAKALGVPMFMAAVSQQVYQMGRASGLSKQDASSLITIYEKLAGVQLGPREES